MWVRRLAWLAAAVVVVGLGMILDPWVRDGFARITWSGLRAPAQWVTDSAEGQWALLAGFIFWVVAWRCHRADWKRVALIVLIASTLAATAICL